MEITSKPNWGTKVVADGVASDALQLYLDDLARLLNDNLLGDRVQLPAYTVAELPPPTPPGGQVFVTDETGGAVDATCDGANWRRGTDRAIVS